MKLSDIFATGKSTLSFEVFPPKTSDKYESVKQATEAIAALRPSFMSVTCGAGGSNRGFTVDIARNIQDKYRVITLAHLTCVATPRDGIDQSLESMAESGIHNILALRGDMPTYEGARVERDFAHASDLAAHISAHGGFCIGGACYPEGHPESISPEADLRNLRIKVEAGCEFLTTQMFFDNDSFYRFRERTEAEGISVPLIAGIMPLTGISQLGRIRALSGVPLPRKLLRIAERFEDNPLALRQAGIAYATEQAFELYSNGTRGVHIYTMNKPEVAEKIQNNLSGVIEN